MWLALDLDMCRAAALAPIDHKTLTGARAHVDHHPGDGTLPRVLHARTRLQIQPHTSREQTVGASAAGLIACC